MDKNEQAFDEFWDALPLDEPVDLTIYRSDGSPHFVMRGAVVVENQDDENAHR